MKYLPDFIYELWYDLKCRFGRHYDPLPDGTCSWCERKVVQ